MNIEKLKQHWYPICRSQDLKHKPKAATMFGMPLVLVRLQPASENSQLHNPTQQDNNTQQDSKKKHKRLKHSHNSPKNANKNRHNSVVRCFDDVCPHRLVPLSKGKVKNGRLQCGYHGWEFDAQGELQCIPGMPTDKNEPHEIYREKQNNLCAEHKAFLTAYPCHEKAGWIWVKLDKTSDKPLNILPACREQLGFDRLTVMRVYEGDFIHTIENFLDPVHTAILHRGIIRSAGMQHMRYKQTHDETGFVGHFTMMNQQNGLVNRLFDPGVNINIATFTVPSHATIEFLVDKDKVYEISWFFIPIDKGVVGMATNIYIPKSKIPAWVKFALMRPLIEYAFAQDKNILATQVKAVARQLARIKQANNLSNNSGNNDANKQKRWHKWQKKQQTEATASNQPTNHNLYKVTPADLTIDHLLHYLADAPEGVDKEGDMILDVD